MSSVANRARDPRRQLEPYWRRRWLILLILIVIPGAAYGISKALPKVYESSTTVLIRSGKAPTTIGQQLAFADAAGAARFITTTAVGTEAAKQLGLPKDSAANLTGRVTAAPEEGGDPNSPDFLTITATAGSPAVAARTANAFADALGAVRTSEARTQISAALDNIKRTSADSQLNGTARNQVELQLQELRALRANQAAGTVVIEPAEIPKQPTSPKPLRNAILAFVFALLITPGIVALLEHFNRRVRDGDELEAILGKATLAVIPTSAFPGQPVSSHTKEAFQTLRSSLTYFNIDQRITSIVVASPTPGDGKTTVATNLAVALARDEQDVVLIDGDMRKPRCAQRLGVDAKLDIETVLMSECSLDDALVEVDAGAGRLRLLPGSSTPPNPAHLLGSKRMQTLLAELRDLGCVVVIDTPPLLVVSDPMALIESCSGTIVVGRVDKTPRDSLARLRQVTEAVHGKILGGVLTGVGAHGGAGYGYYGYGYGYGYGEDDESRDGLLGRLRRNKGGAGADQAPNGGSAETPEAKSKTPV